jgi:hypothetical protein
MSRVVNQNVRQGHQFLRGVWDVRFMRASLTGRPPIAGIGQPVFEKQYFRRSPACFLSGAEAEPGQGVSDERSRRHQRAAGRVINRNCF